MPLQTNNPPTNSLPQTQREIISVSQLNRRARQLLETHLPLLWIEGEISNFARPSSGHWYFTLKDSGAQVKCAMFRNRNLRVQQAPQQGQQVLVRARVSLYEGRGDYQLIIEHMEEAGLGALHRAFDALKAQLHSEGLFDPVYKKTPPSLPCHIGVITSPTGAAIHDILQILERRFPAIRVSVFPVAVQGTEAAPQIVDALHSANQYSNCDLLIVGRGGGSLEDLWPFNEECVARAIFASHIPVVSAVGHEVDITIADYVADLRAPTPSAAAELCSPDGDDMLQQFIGHEILMTEAIERQHSRMHERLLALSARLQHPGQRLQAQAQHLDNLEIRLRQVMQNRLQQQRHRLQNLLLRQYNLSPQEAIKQQQQRLQRMTSSLRQHMQQKLRDGSQVLGKSVALLDSVNPLSILQRGYSVTTDNKQQVIRDSDEVNVGEQVVTQLGKGKLYCTVDAVDRPLI